MNLIYYNFGRTLRYEYLVMSIRIPSHGFIVQWCMRATLKFKISVPKIIKEIEFSLIFDDYNFDANNDITL